MLKDLTELRVYVQPKPKTIIDKLFDELMAGRFSNLTVKEEYFMLEALRTKRDAYVAELDRLNNVDLEEIVNNRLNLVKEQIAEEVKAEFQAKKVAAETKVNDYNSVIADLEAQAVAEVAEVGKPDEPSEGVTEEIVEE